eukprot:358167-Chlamydomonas_euryale.AAC.3
MVTTKLEASEAEGTCVVSKQAHSAYATQRRPPSNPLPCIPPPIPPPPTIPCCPAECSLGGAALGSTARAHRSQVSEVAQHPHMLAKGREKGGDGQTWGRLMLVLRTEHRGPGCLVGRCMCCAEHAHPLPQTILSGPQTRLGVEQFGLNPRPRASLLFDEAGTQPSSRRNVLMSRRE